MSNPEFTEYIRQIMALNDGELRRRKAGGNWFDPGQDGFFQTYLASQEPAIIVYYDAERSNLNGYIEVIGNNPGSVADYLYYQTRLAEEKDGVELAISWDDGENTVTLLKPMLTRIENLDDLESDGLKKSVRKLLDVKPGVPVYLFRIEGHSYQVEPRQAHYRQIWNFD